MTPEATEERLPKAISLVSHNSIEIPASAKSIWRYVLEPNDWKSGLKLRHESGNPEGLEGLFAAVEQMDAAEPTLWAENVEIDVNAVRTIRISTPDGSLVGFSSWMLSQHDQTTTVSYHVYTSLPLGDETLRTMTKEEFLKQQESTNSLNDLRFKEELKRLKDLVLNE